VFDRRNQPTMCSYTAGNRVSRNHDRYAAIGSQSEERRETSVEDSSKWLLNRLSDVMLELLRRRNSSSDGLETFDDFDCNPSDNDMYGFSHSYQQTSKRLGPTAHDEERRIVTCSATSPNRQLVEESPCGVGSGQRQQTEQRPDVNDNRFYRELRRNQLTPAIQGDEGHRSRSRLLRNYDSGDAGFRGEVIGDRGAYGSNGMTAVTDDSGKRFTRDVNHRDSPNKREGGDSASTINSKFAIGQSVSSRPRNMMKPGKFDGSTSLDTFLIQFDTVARYNEWCDDDRCAQLKCCLTGTAGQVLWELGDPDKLTYQQLVERLRARYGSAGQKELFVAQLRARRRRPNETLADLHRDVRRLMALAYPDNSGTTLYEEIAKSHFVSALNDRVLELKVLERDPADLDAAYLLAVRLEAYAFNYGRDNSPEARGNRYRRDKNDEHISRRIAAVEQALQTVTDGNKTRELQMQLNDMAKELGRYRLLEEQRNSAVAESSETNPSATQSRTTTVSGGSNLPRTRQSNIKCFNCGEVGHLSRKCPLKRRQSEANSANTEGVITNNQPSNTPIGQVRGLTKNSTSGPVATYLKLLIFGRRVDCLLDTGSDVTLFPSSIVGKQQLQPSNQKLIAANSTPINVLGTIAVTAKDGRHKFVIDGYVSDHVTDVIIGSEFLHDHGATWDFAKAEIMLDGYNHKLFTRAGASRCRRVVLAESTEVPPQTESVVPAYVVYDRFSPTSPSAQIVWITDVNEPVDGIRVGRVAIPDRNVDIPVRVLNTLKTQTYLKAGTTLASLEPATMNHNEKCKQPSEGDVESVINEIVSRVSERVPVEHKTNLTRLLHDYRAAFSVDETDLGRTSVVKHTIDTDETRPVRQPLRRHPPAHMEAIREQVTMMLQQGVIQPARSPWASNVVMVKKKDDSLRCCIDYRQLNNVTQKDAYPLPRTDMCLESMSGAKWFSTFDLRSGYHQVELAEEDADKTAFICREGMFKFTTMPFGLCNAGATFQRLMDVVMSGLAFEICLVYLDDIIVFSVTLEQHMERLASVLHRLIDAGLKLKPSKCNLMQLEVEFLGHIVSAEGISPHPKKFQQ
jgi:hypothetical protein